MDRRDFLRTSAGTAAALTLGAHHALAAPSAPVDRMTWWRDAKFGMFIHFGLYSEPGGEWNGKATGSHEWMRNNAKIPHEEYIRLAQSFNPTALDVDAWVRTAKEAGQQYIVFTTKHHEGFSLFDSAVSNYTVMHTPYKRDICADLARACRRHGMKLGWYYSIMDWYHPDYLPRRDWEQRDASGADFARYVTFMKAQLRELLTKYGEIAVLWFDGQWESTWTHAAALELEAYCRTLMPNVVINDRIDVGVPKEPPAGYRRAGDYTTPELTVPEHGVPGQDWESCMTMNKNWGYAKDDNEWKSIPELVKLLVGAATGNGNLLLNVGPDGAGRIPQQSLDGLSGMSSWLRINGRAIFRTRGTPFTQDLFVSGPSARTPLRVTRTPRTLNLFLETWPTEPVLLPGLTQVPRSATVLGAPAMRVACSATASGLRIDAGGRAPDGPMPVVQLRFDTPIRFS